MKSSYGLDYRTEEFGGQILIEFFPEDKFFYYLVSDERLTKLLFTKENKWNSLIEIRNFLFWNNEMHFWCKRFVYFMRKDSQVSTESLYKAKGQETPAMSINKND